MILIAALSACGGGGGGGGGVIAPGQAAGASAEAGFTSFAAVAPNQTVVMPGLSQSGSGTATAFGLDPINESNTTARLTYDADGNLSGLSISTPRSSVSFDADQITASTDDSDRRAAFAAGDATSLAVVVDPLHFGWNYQSFGVWMKNVSPTSFEAGALSVGAASPVSALPMSTGRFTGHAGGFYFDSLGKQFATDAQMEAIASFQSQTIQFSTTGTLLSDLTRPTDAPTPNSGLNLSGTLNYAPSGINQFSGDVKTQNLELTGKANGRFYGPRAEEIGGVYGLGSPTGSRMLGGFGGKR